MDRGVTIIYYSIFQLHAHLTVVGLKIDFETSTDLIEARALGYKGDYIHVYSNSWGPSDSGFIVDKPGPMAQAAMETAAREVGI